MKRDYYFILGVNIHSNDADIKKAYYEKCRLLAPHQAPELKLCSSREMSEIIEAYNTLKNPAARHEYDSLPRFRVRLDKDARNPESSTSGPVMEDKTMQMHFPKPLSDKEKQAEVHFHMGVSIITEHGGLDQASQEFRLALKYEPDHPGALYNLGLISWKKGDFNESLSWFTTLREHVKGSLDCDEMLQSLTAEQPKGL
ncbi:MAG: DnaJ domain-containing protein [Vulcanimicrobiota bacterium]